MHAGLFSTASSPLVCRIAWELQYDRMLTLGRFYPESDNYKHSNSPIHTGHKGYIIFLWVNLQFFVFVFILPPIINMTSTLWEEKLKRRKKKFATSVSKHLEGYA